MDLYALLEVFSLDQLLQACHHKYPDLSTQIVKKASVHFDDIEFSTPISFIDQEVKWPVIADRLNRAYRDIHLRFGPSSIGKAILEKQPPVKKGKNKRRKI